MNSHDPWRYIMTTTPHGRIIVPGLRYGHPFYREVPSWIHYDDPAYGGTSRLTFDGTFVGSWADTTGDHMMNYIGAELTALSAPGFGFRPWYRPYYPYGGYPYGGVFLGAESGAPAAEPSPRRGLTAELAPILAPATGGVTVEKRLDERQVLHVKICVDGKCYSTSMDLAPGLAMVMQKLAQSHVAYHAPKPPPSTVVSTVETAVGMAESAIVGALIAQHVDTIAAGILGDIAGAVKGAVTGVAKGVASTFRQFKGPIGAAAGIAAAAGASLIPGVGPLAAPIAAKLANDLVNAAAGDTSAQQAITQATQQAKTDPAVKAALTAAEKAVANSTAAHHVQDAARKAARGDRAAQQQIVQVAEDAEQGDPAAKAVANLVAEALKSEWGSKLLSQIAARAPGVVSGWPWYDVTTVGQWYDVVGAAVDDIRETALAHANTKRGQAAGVIQYADGTVHGRGFGSLARAIEWLQHATRARAEFIYAAAYDKATDGTAYIQAEEFGQAQPPTPRGAPTTIG